MRSVLCLVGLVLSSLPLLAVTIGKPAKSRVPAWDVRGPLTLPSQGTACLDATADGRFCAVGTIAMPGDAQLFLLDDTGHVVEAHPVGERGVTEVAVGDNGAFVAALVGVPAGTAGDIPVVKLFVDGKPAPLNNDFVPGFRALFHYGDHSNHLGHQLQAVGDRLAIGGASEVAWVTPRTGVMNRAPLGKVGAGELSTFACAADGHAVVGRAVGKDAGKALGVLGPTGALWSIAPGDEDGPALDFGVYGPAAGKPIDTRVWAPLSVAMGRDGARCAAAEYPGWSRHFPRGDDYGLHYPAARPAISVYDAAGAVLCHVDPAKLDPGWYDLAFTADGARLLIYPHSYPSQGLGGVGFLPADLPAHTLYVLTIADGTVAPVTFPDAVAGVAEANGRLAVSCWNGTLYLLDAALKPLHEIDLGAAALLRASTDGSRILAAGTDGVVHGLDADGHARWRTDLHAVAPPGVKPWTLNQTARKIGDVWAKSTQRTHSDMGNQYYIEAPDGILLIDPNSGLSIEQNFAQMRAAGLDPLRVKYILLTHEHGDHAPGAYLWRLLTGAQVVSSPEMATSLQHHIPTGTGYGFHPPQPTDIIVDKERTLDLAGLPVTVIHLPGHTYGSLGYIFMYKGKRYAALGDLIMPGGTLGYAGSVDFSAADVLASLRKLGTYKPDIILGGHGQGDPSEFIGKGIAAGVATGWGHMTPEQPDPMYAFTRKNYLITAWRQPIYAAAFGDIDGDGNADAAVLVRDGGRVVVQLFRNADGTLPTVPDAVVEVPGFTPDSMSKLRIVHLTPGPAADLVVTAELGSALLLAQEGKLAYKVLPLPGTRLTQVLVSDFPGDGHKGLVLGGRFVGRFYLATVTDGGVKMNAGTPTACSFDMALADIFGDGKPALVTAAGEIFPRTATGFADTPAFKLAVPSADGWNYLAAADFNGDGKPDVALLANTPTAGARLFVYYHTGDATRPYAEKPDLDVVLPKAFVNRDGPTVGDWDGDGIPDLIVQGPEGAVVVPGGKGGLDPAHTTRIPLDYNPHFDTKLAVGDFTGHGKAELAGWGATFVGATGVYIWTR